MCPLTLGTRLISVRKSLSTQRKVITRPTKETSPRGQALVPTASNVPGKSVTPMDYSSFGVSEANTSDVYCALAVGTNYNVQLPAQRADNELKVLKSLLMEDNNIELMDSQPEKVLDEEMRDEMADIHRALDGDTNINTHLAPQQVNEQLCMLRSFLVDLDDQNACQTGFETGFQLHRPHPYNLGKTNSNLRKNNAGMSCSQESGSMLARRPQETLHYSSGVLTATITPVAPQSGAQTQPFFTSPSSMEYFQAIAPPGAAWESPTDQWGVRGGSVRLTHLDSPMQAPVTLPATTRSTGANVVHRGSVEGRPSLLADFPPSYGTTNSPSRTKMTPSLSANTLNHQAQVLVSGPRSSNHQRPAACCRKGNISPLHHESRTDNVIPSWDMDSIGPSYAYSPGEVGSVLRMPELQESVPLASDQRHVTCDSVLSSTQTAICTPTPTGLTHMGGMVGVLESCVQNGGNYNSPLTNGYSLPADHPVYRKGSSSSHSQQANQNGTYSLSGQQTPKPKPYQNGTYSPPGQQHPSPPTYQNGTYIPPGQQHPSPPTYQNGTYIPPGQQYPSPPTYQNGTYIPSGEQKPSPPAYQNGTYIPSGQQKPSPPAYQNGTYIPSGQQNPTHQPYHRGEYHPSTTNGYIQTPHAMQSYQTTGQTCISSSFSGNNKIPYAEFGPTVQGTAPFVPHQESLRELLAFGTSLPNTTH